MAKHTSFRVGGPAEALFEPENVEQLKAFVTRAFERAFPIGSWAAGRTF